MSGAAPTIGVDVFKDLINEIKNDLKSQNSDLKTDLGTMGTKLDNINARLNNQDLRISDLGQRVETLEKHISTHPSTYAEAAKSPPKPQQSSSNANTTLSTLNSTSTSSLQNLINSTPYSQAQPKNHDLTAEEIMHRSKHIIGIYPITPQDIERNKSDTNTKTLINTATEFLQCELGFRLEQIAEMQIKKVTKTKKSDGKTLYITFQNHSHVAQIFKRTATLKNNNLKISNYVPPHCYNRYQTLQAHCKTAREIDDQLRTKIIYGTSDLILQEKKVGELRYTTVNIDKYGELPPIDLSLLWPTHELEVPLTTPPKGRPSQTITQTHQKRQHSSPENTANTSFTTVKNKRHKKSKKKINAESSISDHNNSSDEESSQTNEVARMHQIITGKRSYTKKDFKKN